MLKSSVADPNPDPPDPHVFGPPGSGSNSQSLSLFQLPFSACMLSIMIRPRYASDEQKRDPLLFLIGVWHGLVVGHYRVVRPRSIWVTTHHRCTLYSIHGRKNMLVYLGHHSAPTKHCTIYIDVKHACIFGSPLITAVQCTVYIKGTVQWELRWDKIVINRSILMYSFAGKCPLPCPNGHHHERSINVFSVCGTF